MTPPRRPANRTIHAALLLALALPLLLAQGAPGDNFRFHLEAESLALEKTADRITAEASGSVVLTTAQGERFEAGTMSAVMQSALLEDPVEAGAELESPFSRARSRVQEIRMGGPLTYRWRGLTASASSASSTAPEQRWNIAGSIRVNYSRGGRTLQAQGGSGVLSPGSETGSVSSVSATAGLEDGELEIEGGQLSFPLSLESFELSSGTLVHRSDERVSLQAPSLTYLVGPEKFTASGGTEVEIRDFTVTSDSVEVWTGEKRAVASGSVRVSGPEGSTDAERAEIDFSSEQINISLQGQRETQIEL